jgi:hypothetical protein
LVLESVTGVKADTFAALSPVAQAAVIARVVPERLRTLDASSAEAVVAVTQRAINALAGIRDVAIAACVRAEELTWPEVDGEGVPGDPYRQDAIKIVASSLAPMLASTPRAMEAKVRHALTVVDDMPKTLQRILDGGLGERHSAVISRHAGLLEPDAVPVFDRELHLDPAVTTLPPGKLTRACERAAIITDSDAMERKVARAVEERFVRVEPDVAPGMAFWRASLGALESAKAWAAIDELAREYVRADGTRLIDQARADAMLDLLLGSATVSTTVELVVPTFVEAPLQAPSGPLSASAATETQDSALQGPTAEGSAVHPTVTPESPPCSSETAETAEAADDVAPDPAREAAWLEQVGGPAIGKRWAIGSELFGKGHPDLDELPEASAVKRLVMMQHEATARERQAVAERVLASHGIRFPEWRPPEFGVRDSRVGWLLTRTLLEVLTDPDVVLRLTRADAMTGVTVSRDPAGYRPNAALAQRIRDRDRTCRFPGCGVAARRCDIDHVVPFPEGSTSEDNLMCLCRTHHGFKHHARWTVALQPDGSCSWASPTGRTYVTRPSDVRQDAA